VGASTAAHEAVASKAKALTSKVFTAFMRAPVQDTGADTRSSEKSMDLPMATIMNCQCGG
jgi:hypothetical protein